MGDGHRNGRYRILRRLAIGHGAHSTVWLAQNHHLQSDASNAIDMATAHRSRYGAGKTFCWRFRPRKDTAGEYCAVFCQSPVLRSEIA